MEKSIKEWYLTYFSDDEGHHIDENATFMGLFECLDDYQDVYEYIGYDDSLIRERCFTELARLIDVDYDYIYSQWLMAR